MLKSNFKRSLRTLLSITTAMMLMTGCMDQIPEIQVTPEETSTGETKTTETTAAGVESGGTMAEGKEGAADTKEPEKNGEVVLLFTSDVHCGMDKGFGYAGLQDVRDKFDAEGYTTMLIDDGDFIQGEAVGTLTKGEDLVKLMNSLNYDFAVVGNHEFDYGMDQFMKISEMANFPLISCNFRKNGELVFEPYVVKEICGIKIGFVGVTTPTTITTSTPKFFQDDKGEYIYDFMQDDTGDMLYEAVQKSVDDVRAQGASYVYLVGHLGMYDDVRPWTYADVISHTSGIDVCFDGHSHDTEHVVMKDKDGKDVPRFGLGTKLNVIGYSHLNKDKGIVDTNVWSWANDVSLPDLLGIKNKISKEIDNDDSDVNKLMGKVVAHSSVELTVNDPREKDSKGQPVRMVRRAETNLGDLCADAYRDQTGADIGIINGGGIRAGIQKGDVTYGDIINVNPFGDTIVVIEAKGQQIIDVLEWGAKNIPDEDGGFIQVSGLSYEIDASVKSGAKKDDKGMCTGFEGKRRVKNVKVGDNPIDPSKTYTVAGINYLLQENGNGITSFDGCKVVQNNQKLDNQILIDYITETLNGEIGDEYKDPYGQGRIVIHDEGENS
ncbi:2',3'-cyclic-nucleotide 2'-phosphodiesterase/5'-or 3'-nucleotidase, 5'-nucleotidase family [Oribacterium sp. KHPX15]|uniref:bifunctional metallophosphatase/5'-nucleotidase n=1 Tax=Oribacterium sp. KHPX15 TaxID=1855342 RepID=UPI00089BA1BC|nr:bifunctional UDP-sugar hydrolase/5'-nucleotidase [Oribacterium sp. KHPX15]SEA67941.1 2',3'-cyclic-nucleotide 2'-phosphodiesterase/5'-or 3'-nucleotidase, 5'-nucleotidase family [Oribacterium sp. KHPX15]